MEGCQMFGVAVVRKHAWNGRFLFLLSVSQTLLLLPFDWSSEPTLLLRGILHGAVNEKPFRRTEMKLGDQKMVFASGVRFWRGSRSVFLSRARELGKRGRSMHRHANEVVVGFGLGPCKDGLVGVANEVLERSHHQFSFFVAVYAPRGWWKGFSPPLINFPFFFEMLLSFPPREPKNVQPPLVFPFSVKIIASPFMESQFSVRDDMEAIEVEKPSGQLQCLIHCQEKMAPTISSTISPRTFWSFVISQAKRVETRL